VGYHLIEAGIQAVVLDRRDIGWGSTAASTALLQYEIDTPLHELAEIVGWDDAARSYQACRDAIYKLRDLALKLDEPCGFELKPSLYMTKRPRDVKVMNREYEARCAAGFDVEWWSEDEVAQKMGFKCPCGIYSKDGAQVDVYRLAYRLLERAEQMGLQVYDRTTVLNHTVNGSRVIVRTDRGASIKARHIVFAGGYESQQTIGEKLAVLKSTFALVSEPLTQGESVWHEDCLIWEHAHPYLYLRTTDDHRVIVGGEDEDFQNADKRDALIPKKTRVLLRKFNQLFPQIPLEVAFAWAGTFGETVDGLPLIGQHRKFPRAYFTLGFGGNGITYSILAAEIVRDGILGKPSPYDGLFGFDR
jgi:glycine/D-amino acid oxidase-like deaminating enzyme